MKGRHWEPRETNSSYNSEKSGQLKDCKGQERKGTSTVVQAQLGKTIMILAKVNGVTVRGLMDTGSRWILSRSSFSFFKKKKQYLLKELLTQMYLGKLR